MPAERSRHEQKDIIKQKRSALFRQQSFLSLSGKTYYGPQLFLMGFIFFTHVTCFICPVKNNEAETAGSDQFLPESRDIGSCLILLGNRVDRERKIWSLNAAEEKRRQAAANELEVLKQEISSDVIGLKENVEFSARGKKARVEKILSDLLATIEKSLEKRMSEMESFKIFTINRLSRDLRSPLLVTTDVNGIASLLRLFMKINMKFVSGIAAALRIESFSFRTGAEAGLFLKETLQPRVKFSLDFDMKDYTFRLASHSFSLAFKLTQDMSKQDLSLVEDVLSAKKVKLVDYRGTREFLFLPLRAPGDLRVLHSRRNQLCMRGWMPLLSSLV